MQETKRKQLALAAEQRQKENVQRGVKDAESLKRKQQKREERERILDSQPNTSGPLRVNFHFY